MKKLVIASLLAALCATASADNIQPQQIREGQLDLIYPVVTVVNPEAQGKINTDILNRVNQIKGQYQSGDLIRAFMDYATVYEDDNALEMRLDLRTLHGKRGSHSHYWSEGMTYDKHTGDLVMQREHFLNDDHELDFVYPQVFLANPEAEAAINKDIDRRMARLKRQYENRELYRAYMYYELTGLTPDTITMVIYTRTLRNNGHERGEFENWDTEITYDRKTGAILSEDKSAIYNDERRRLDERVNRPARPRNYGGTTNRIS